MDDAQLRQCIDYGVDNDAERRRRTALAGRTHAERVRCRRYFADVRGKKRQNVGAGHRVVHERSRQKLSRTGVVETMLEESLPHALGDAAMGLTMDDQRVHRPTNVIDRGVADDFDKAHFRVYLDFAYVAA